MNNKDIVEYQINWSVIFFNYPIRLLTMIFWNKFQANTVPSWLSSEYSGLLRLVLVLQASPWRLYVFAFVLRASADLGTRLGGIGVPAATIQPLRLFSPGSAAIFGSEFKFGTIYFLWQIRVANLRKDKRWILLETFPIVVFIESSHSFLNSYRVYLCILTKHSIAQVIMPIPSTVNCVHKRHYYDPD